VALGASALLAQAPLLLLLLLLVLPRLVPDLAAAWPPLVLP
jgi:hypothetical protein